MTGISNISKPVKPDALLLRLAAEVATATGLAPDRVFVTPAAELIGKLPPAGQFASVVPVRVTFPGLPQHDEILLADLHFTVCLYSRVAMDRTFDATALLTDPNRGLLPIADKVFLGLSGNRLVDPDDPQGQWVRNPVQCVGIEPTRWGEGANLVLAYVELHYVAPFVYDTTRP